MKKKLLFISIHTSLLCLLLCILCPSAGLAVRAEEAPKWEINGETYDLIVDGNNTMPQLVGMFYFTDQKTGQIAYGPELDTSYDLHLIIGAIGEDPAENVHVQFDLGEPKDSYGNSLKLQATISADNYDSIVITDGVYFLGEEGCELLLPGTAQLARDRSTPTNSIPLAESLENPISLNTADEGSIAPGPDNVCEIIMPCSFRSEPPTYTEANQPSETRINVISDNSLIGNERTNSAWVADENGNSVVSLNADQTYTAHFYIRVSGPEATTNATILSSVIDQEIVYADYSSWNPSVWVKADGVKSFLYNIDYPVQTDIRLHYVAGSLSLHRNNQEDLDLDPTRFFSDDARNKGIQIGTAGLDGVINPGTDSACEVTYQFSTTDYGAELEAEEAKEATREAEPPLPNKAEVAKEVEETDDAKTPTFSQYCSVWLTNEKGNEVYYLAPGGTYTVHASIRINGEGQAEGVKVSSSNLSSLTLDEHSRNLYFKLTGDNLESSTISETINRSRSTEEILTLNFVKNSLQMKSATGTCSLPSEDFFNYETGCLIGFSEPNGIIPAGGEHTIEITYQFKVSSDSSKRITSVNLLRQPVFSIILLVICILEFICIIFMAFCPNNRLARFISRCRRFVKSVKNSISIARADLRNDKEQTSASSKTKTDTKSNLDE